MHAQMAKESGHFDFDSVCKLVDEKLITRHPHVFGDTRLEDTDAAMNQWEAIKAKEKKRGPKQKGIFKDLPRQLPALLFAKDVFKQSQKMDVDISESVNRANVDAIAEDIDEASVGRQLFEIAAACRLKKIDPESALRRYTQAIIDRAEAV